MQKQDTWRTVVDGRLLPLEDQTTLDALEELTPLTFGNGQLPDETAESHRMAAEALSDWLADGESFGLISRHEGMVLAAHMGMYLRR